MTTTKDYAKPVGWWCPACGDREWGDAHRQGCRDKHINRFAPLPVPEPGADEPDDDTVVNHCGINLANVMLGRGPSTTTQMVSSERWAFKEPSTTGDGFEPAPGSPWETALGTAEQARGVSLADAVLWVAEGRIGGDR